MNIQTFKKSVHIDRAVLGFSGWPDAGKLVEFTIIQLKNLIPHELAAVWDLDGFWQAESTRPQINVQHGQVQRIEWPCYQFFIARPGESSGPILLGSGPEPSLAWRSFAKDLIRQLKSWGCREIYLLGSLLDQIFHDETLISSVVQDSGSYNRVRELGCELIEYTGPSAVHSVIMAEAKESGISCMCFWAHLPFYLSGPSELIAVEFLRILGNMLGVKLSTDNLMRAWQKREKQIEQLVHQDQGLRQTLESLRKQKVMRRSDFTPKVVQFEDFLKKRNEPDDDKD